MSTATAATGLTVAVTAAPAPAGPADRLICLASLQSEEHPLRRRVEVLGPPRVPGLRAFRLCRDLLTGEDLLIHASKLKPA